MKQKSLLAMYGVGLMYQLGHSFFYATYVLFLMRAGLTFIEINSLNAVYMITTATLEVPTGAIADRYGRKASFLAATGLLALSMFLYYRADGYLGFMLAEFLGAIGAACHSGAYISWLIDTAKAGGSTGSSTEVIRVQQIAARLGVMVGSVAGAYLGAIDLSWPWLAAAIGSVITGITALPLNEPEWRHDMTPGKGSAWSKWCRALKPALTIRAVAVTAILGAAFCFACQPLNMFWQPCFRDELGFSVEWLGWLYVMIQGLFMGGAFAVKRFIGSTRVFPGLVAGLILFAVGSIVAATSAPLYLVLTAFAAHEFGRGMFSPLLEGYLNDRIPSSTRATVNSAVSMAEHGGAFLGLFVSGFIAQFWSISASWIVSGLVVLVPIVWLKRNGHHAR